MLLPALLIVAAAVVLMVRRVEVRLVLLGAGLLLALLGRQPLAITDTFTRAMVAAMVAPICAAMGFAAVLSATGCDRELVALLLAPVRRVRWLVVPGGILVAYLVNVAIPSQTSAAAALGPVLLPLMLASGVGAETAGAALVLGASFGGDLLNPGAQDVQAVAGTVGIAARSISGRVVPASLAGVFAATLTFALLRQREPRPSGEQVGSPAEATAEIVPAARDTGPDGELGPPEERTAAVSTSVLRQAVPPEPEQTVHLGKALIPLVPILLLLLAYAGVPRLAWLVEAGKGDPLANALPVVRAMLIGTLLAAATVWRELPEVTRKLFDGMGAAYAGIISLTISAQCFGAGLAAAGVSEALLRLLGHSGVLTQALSVALPWLLATLSGSGSGPVLTYAQTFLAHVGERHDPALLGALACLGGAFGRTMSPVAAVVIYSSGLSGVPPLVLVRRLLPALLVGAAVAVGVVLLGPFRR